VSETDSPSAGDVVSGGGQGEREASAGCETDAGAAASPRAPGAGAMPSRPDPDAVGRVAVVGTGLIGARWAAFFLSRGLEVTATDPAAGAEARLRDVVDRCWPALERLGLGAGASRERLRFVGSLPAAVSEAGFVQENVPDDEALKADVIAAVDAACPPGTVIASSTSGIPPSLLQASCAHPERVLAGHPSNPAHLLPLVEVVAGERTDPAAVDWAMAFYRHLGKRPLRVRREAPGFVMNRLQEAVWREAFHLVNDDIATCAELDATVTDGCGMRWALFGPAFVYLLQGGPGGMAWALEQFDPARIPDWSHNAYPEITAELKATLDEQTREQAAGRTLEEWEALRDEFLVRVLELKRELFGAY
jgi:carnitine 3-dehydrogenase